MRSGAYGPLGLPALNDTIYFALHRDICSQAEWL